MLYSNSQCYSSYLYKTLNILIKMFLLSSLASCNYYSTLHLDDFDFLSIVLNIIAINIRFQISFQKLMSLPLYIYSEVGLLDHVICLLF